MWIATALKSFFVSSWENNKLIFVAFKKAAEQIIRVCTVRQ